MRPKSAAAVAAFVLHVAAQAAAFADIEDDFKNPPISARPYVWWHWMGPNFSKSGITKDLEAMKAAGIGGATIFNIASAVQESHKPTENNPWPQNTYRSPAYWDAVRHAAAEAKRLGLEVGLHNTVGYSTTGGPWITEESNMQRVLWTKTTVDGGKLVTATLAKPEIPPYRGWGNTGQKLSFFRDIAVLAVPAEGVVPPDKIINISDKMDAQGEVKWDAPAGKWTLVRLGHGPTGAIPHPLPDDLIGKTLEADKMSREITQLHWNQVIDPLKKELGPLLGTGMRHFLIDSYEAGSQNWTPKFREEFQKRKGYDPLPWMVTLVPGAEGKSGRVVANAEQSARFSWDFNDVIATLFYENGWLPGVEKMKSVGATLQFEPYGGQFDTIEGAALADLPMGEFWTNGKGGINGNIVAAARAAGRRVVGAEAFTGSPGNSKWNETPAFLKLSADGTFGTGVNRLVLHHWVHQPFDDRYQPGMGMGWWGTHFNRHQTWFEPGKEFFAYLGRTQALLQRGETPADFVSVGGSHNGSDAIAWRAFLTADVRGGKIVLPSGRVYPFVYVPHSGALLPASVEKIKVLLQKGGTVVAARPQRSPSLSGFPACDETVQRLAAEIWGEAPEKSRVVGSGRLFTELGEALKAFAITPAIQISGANDIRTAHRREGSTDLVFVANTQNTPQRFTVSLRGTGRRPELWDAETGTRGWAPIWRTRDGRTEVDLQLGAVKSVFVVLRAGKSPAEHVVGITSTQGSAAPKILAARFGTPEGNRWMDAAPRLRELIATGAIDAEVEPRLIGRDPVPNVVKQLEIDIEENGQKRSLILKEGERLKLGVSAKASWQAQGLPGGGVRLYSHEATDVEVKFASGKTQAVVLEAARASEIAGPWQVALVSPVENKREIVLPALKSLSEVADVKYFSGTATYNATFELSAEKGRQVLLDLGDVRDLAQVTLNGQNLGVKWHAPFVFDLTRAAKTGENRISIAVTNTWHNRLVGDEQHPADFEWGEDRGGNGRAMKGYPDWFLKNQPRPQAGRKGFVIWYYHRPDTPLLPSGLLGPVRLVWPSVVDVGR